MEQSLNNLVNEAMIQWVAVTGVNLDSNHYKLKDYDIREATEQLNESRELDETGLTTWMLLRGLSEDYMRQTTFSAHSIIFESAEVTERLAAMHALHTTLEDPLVNELIDKFISAIRATAEHFMFKNNDGLDVLLNDKYALAQIHRDAILSMQRLHTHQFCQGEVDASPISLNQNVLEIWNINSLIRALRNQNIPGITMVLVRDPEAVNSFFVFAIKNHENITILSDKDDDAHPASKRMTRRPDRRLMERAQRNWFPYELLDVEASEDGKHLYENARTQLVPINVNAVKLAHISDLSPETFVWCMLLSELIKNKFSTQNYHTDELSYTGEMIVEPHSLIGEASALVKTGQYPPLELPRLTTDDITSETTAKQWVSTPTYFNSWMVDRYGSEVSDDVLNVVGEASASLLQSANSLEQREPGQRSWYDLHHFDPQSFGTKASIEEDRVWVARMNQMKVVQNRARSEYEATQEELLLWYKEAIRQRGNFFADAAAQGELYGPQYNPGETFGRTEPTLGTTNLLRYQIEGTGYGGKHENDYVCLISSLGDVSLTDHRRDYNATSQCFDHPTRTASIFTMFYPNCPEALALFLGLSLDELPWQLQHWYPKDCKPYGGNCILERIDPIDWVLKNPWSAFSFRVGVPLSKSAFKARRKALGLPPIVVPEQE